jgi:hypothetical protein
MRARSKLLVPLAIAACAGLLIMALQLQARTWVEEVPNPEYGKSANAVTLPYSMVHYYRVPTAAETAISIALMVVALAGVSLLAARLSSQHKIVSGTVAAVISATLTLSVLAVMAQRMPQAQTICIGILGAAVVGIAAAWLSARWWPNKSLERTREE